MKKKFTPFLFIISLFIFNNIYSAITVNINSGNPTMPFPQFINYPAGGQTTLYSIADWAHLPDGVTHAELEKWIRDAYQIMMNRANYAGGTIRGVQGIRFESQPFCSEGHGYALLAAALMGDKTTFDGLWFYLNDNCWFNGVARYSNGQICSPAYPYGYHAPGWNGPGADSAADGDVDIALAALIAWRQWGDNTGYTRWDGQPIRYRDMALDMMRFLVEKAEGTVSGDGRYTSGIIGYDGYAKGGNTWGELTNWAVSGGYPAGDRPEFGGPQANSWYDYSAPYYYRCFAEALQANGDSRDTSWNIPQFQKAAAAMNWVMGQLAASSHRTTYAGQYTVNGTSVTFANANPGGEDFRA
ncbi:MAG: glycosyl hydrolase family 8, partial [Candidatus Goldbacteria bacterium]|nr:glycosyl hydrolase family 8 [Candidatus Goldiibacteriota bacterium]